MVSRVPRFTSLDAFIRYKRWFTQLPVFVPGPERHDLAARMRRHEKASIKWTPSTQPTVEDIFERVRLIQGFDRELLHQGVEDRESPFPGAAFLHERAGLRLAGE